jgi:hypothetical protein
VFEIGSSLRVAREHRQLELPEVERATHIRARYLAALEDERFSVLPAPAYAKGFLRTYADFLGLDGARFVDEFNERFAPAELPEAPPPVRVPSPRRVFGARLVAIPLAVGIGLFAWRLASGGGHPQRNAALTPPPSHIRASSAVAPPTPVTPKPKRASIAFLAAGGSCWLAVRRGSSTGQLLYEGTLQPGQRMRFAGSRLWIRIGAPWNVDATLDGKAVRLPASVGDVMVTPAAVRSL